VLERALFIDPENYDAMISLAKACEKK